MDSSAKSRGPLLPHLLFAVLIGVIFLPGRRAADPPWLFLLALALIQAFYLVCRRRGNSRAAGDITVLLYGFFLLWEVMSAKLGLTHRILVPLPENVFFAFYRHGALMLKGIGSSLSLLAAGFGVGLPLSLFLGVTAGLIPRLQQLIFPIAKVLAPIPPIIYAPYLIALAPGFRWAAAMVLVIGIFLPNLMTTINRVSAMDKTILNAARALNVRGGAMMFHVVLPYLLPGVIGGLRVTLSTSFMLLMLAEMMGATSGLGYFVRNFADFANYTNVAAGIILIGIVITALNQLVTLAEGKLIRWL
ncbi:MAG: ABC transporter permease subunit [Peptococcaceae bacterium]|nr:ABC transporter permease subunit [Peptococcaceae bacterium]